MKLSVRSQKRLTLTIQDETYEVGVVELPFREGVELRCRIGDEELRVSDRGLGEHEALRLMEDEIRRWRGLLEA